MSHFISRAPILRGTKEQLPRWGICANEVDGDLGDALGKAYVEKYFPPEAKRRMSALVENLRAALREELEQSEWMQAETKKNAILKLNALQIKIGYPDVWRDYSKLRINRRTYLENIRAAGIYDRRYILDKLGKPVNRTDWGMTAPTVNASSNPLRVEVVFPAGILAASIF